jgi:hypothetical protein
MRVFARTLTTIETEGDTTVKTLKRGKVLKIAMLMMLTSVVLIGGGTGPAPAVAEPSPHTEDAITAG